MKTTLTEQYGPSQFPLKINLVLFHFLFDITCKTNFLVSVQY